jgi:hypothetical protein
MHTPTGITTAMATTAEDVLELLKPEPVLPSLLHFPLEQNVPDGHFIIEQSPEKQVLSPDLSELVRIKHSNASLQHPELQYSAVQNWLLI